MIVIAIDKKEGNNSFSPLRYITPSRDKFKKRKALLNNKSLILHDKQNQNQNDEYNLHKISPFKYSKKDYNNEILA